MGDHQLKKITGGLRAFLIVVLCLFGCEQPPAKIDTHAATPPEVKDTTQTALNFDDYTHPYLTKANQILKSEGVEKAIDYYHTALDLFEKEKDWPGYVRTANFLAHEYNGTDQSDQSKILLTKARKIVLENFGSKNTLMADILEHFGEYFYYEQEADSALTVYDQCLIIRENIYQGNHLKIADTYYGIGNVHRWRRFDPYSAEKYYNLELKQRIALNDKKIENFIFCYYNLAEVNRNKKDTQQALLYAKKALDILESNKTKGQTFIRKCYNLMGTLSHEAEKYDEAINYYRKAIDLLKNYNLHTSEDNTLALYYTNIGAAHLTNNKFEEGFKYLEKALNIYQKNKKIRNVSDIYYRMGQSFIALDSLNRSTSFFKKGLQLNLAFYGKKNIKTSNSYKNLGEVFLKSEQLDSALDMTQESLKALIPGFDERDPVFNPTTTLIEGNFSIIHPLRQKATIYKKMYDRDSSAQALSHALNSYILADSVIDLERASFKLENSKLSLGLRNKEIYENAIDCSFLLKEKTDSSRIYQQVALDFMEKSKSRLLYENLEKVERLHRAGISDSVKNKELNLKAEGAYLDKLLAKQKESDAPDPVKINRIENRIFDNIQEQNSLRDFLRDAYPGYFNIRYENAPVSLIELQTQSLNKNEQIIEYFWGDSAIYVIGIDQKKVRFEKIKPDALFQTKLDAFIKTFGDLNITKNSRQKYGEYTENGWWLYNQLLAPVIDPDLNQVTIIPDGALAFLPFEALINKKPVSTAVNYKDLDYLIKHKNISYAYSVNLLHNSTYQSPDQGKKLLALSYSGDVNALSNSTQQRSGFDQLQGAHAEIESIQKVVAGEFIKGDEATESNFKQLAGQHDIIHLAIHGSASKNDSIDAQLHFRKEKDSLEDGTLYPYELYNIDLKARLAVLSACETGLGDFKKGEGVFSMARGFAYAGCPSVVMSLWKVNDQTSATLMKQFYKGLRSGEAIDRSLKNAKLKYLDDADELTAHPAYWAAFVPIGRTAPVFESYVGYYWSAAIGSLCLLLILMAALFLKKRRATIAEKEPVLFGPSSLTPTNRNEC